MHHTHKNTAAISCRTCFAAALRCLLLNERVGLPADGTGALPAAVSPAASLPAACTLAIGSDRSLQQQYGSYQKIIGDIAALMPSLRLIDVSGHDMAAWA